MKKFNAIPIHFPNHSRTNSSEVPRLSAVCRLFFSEHRPAYSLHTCIFSLALALLSLLSLSARADERPYLCELGIQAGCGYYVGDATTHIFNHPREAYGAHFRYKFDQRWALQVKGLTQRIAGPDYNDQRQRKYDSNGKSVLWQNNLINVDAMAEFNFFRFGAKSYDRRVKPITPYIFLGAGVALYGNGQNAFSNIAFYIPCGLGMKWKFSERFGLNLAWQHNIYMADNLEGVAILDNAYHLNGSNLLNFDVTSQLTLGIVFEFAKEKKVCRTCRY